MHPGPQNQATLSCDAGCVVVPGDTPALTGMGWLLALLWTCILGSLLFTIISDAFVLLHIAGTCRNGGLLMSKCNAIYFLANLETVAFYHLSLSFEGMDLTQLNQSLTTNFRLQSDDSPKIPRLYLKFLCHWSSHERT